MISLAVTTHAQMRPEIESTLKWGSSPTKGERVMVTRLQLHTRGLHGGGRVQHLLNYGWQAKEKAWKRA